MPKENEPIQQNSLFEKQIGDLQKRIGELEQINESLHQQLNLVLSRNSLLISGASSYNSLNQEEQEEYTRLTGVQPDTITSSAQSNQEAAAGTVDYNELENVMQDIYTQNAVLKKGIQQPTSLNEAEKNYFEQLTGKPINNEVSDSELQLKQQALEQRQEQIALVVQQLVNENQQLRGRNSLLVRSIQNPESLSAEENEALSVLLTNDEQAKKTLTRNEQNSEQSGNSNVASTSESTKPLSTSKNAEVRQQSNTTENSSTSEREKELEEALKLMQQQNQQLMIGMNLLARAAQDPNTLNEQEKEQYRAITGVSLTTGQTLNNETQMASSGAQQSESQQMSQVPEDVREIIEKAQQAPKQAEVIAEDTMNYRSTAPEHTEPEVQPDEKKSGFRTWIEGLLPVDKNPITWLVGLGVGVLEAIGIAGLFGPGAVIAKTGLNALVLDRTNAVKQDNLRKQKKEQSGLMSGIAAGAMSVLGLALAGELSGNPMVVDYWDRLDFPDFGLFDDDDTTTTTTSTGTPAPVPVPAIPTGGITYTVQPGDTVWDILLDHGITPTQERIGEFVLDNANTLKNENLSRVHAYAPLADSIESIDDLVSGFYDPADISTAAHWIFPGQELLIDIDDDFILSFLPSSSAPSPAAPVIPPVGVAPSVPGIPTTPIAHGFNAEIGYGNGILNWYNNVGGEAVIGLGYDDLRNGYTFNILKDTNGDGIGDQIIGTEYIHHTNDGWKTIRRDLAGNQMYGLDPNYYYGI